MTDQDRRGAVKCVVWDLDDTLWDGTLLEGDDCRVSPDVREIVEILDRRGILQSVASRNDPDAVAVRLDELGLAEMFLYPQVGWHEKSTSVARIAQALNFGLDALAFVDDQEFERAEVAHAHPQVTVLGPGELTAAVASPAFTPRFITPESARRRHLYRVQQVRQESEQDFAGSNEAFLRTLDITFTVRSAGPEDLQRAEELTVRTNQLNSTGTAYSYGELEALRSDPGHVLLVAEMSDRFGEYGTIGLALAERAPGAWHLRLLLMSCRTMSRGVGTILLGHVMRLAAADSSVLRADLVETGRNRVMQVTYAFAGFREIDRDGPRVVLESDVSTLQAYPDYVTVVIADGADVARPTS